jgi:hypothetical protein
MQMGKFSGQMVAVRISPSAMGARKTVVGLFVRKNLGKH